MSDSGPPVDPTRRDRALSALQGLTGIVPAIGPILANLISQIIPEQRWERIGEYLRKLERRVAEVEARTLASALREPRKVDLFEDGAWAADVAQVGAALAERLVPCREGKGVVDVRTLGAIGVVEFDAPVAVGELCARFAELGAWIRPMGKVIYLTPAFTTPDEDLALLTSAVRKAAGVA